MRRPILLAAGLLLVSSAVLADMYQDAKNAKLPEARQNLELGTVKSEGGTPPNADAVTRFYNGSGTKQFEIGTSEYAGETVLEQAGLPAPGGVGVGQGATRLCWSPASNNQVNCNYVAFGTGLHRFANGAGYLTEMASQGTGAVNAWPKLIAADDGTARVAAASGSLTADSNLQLQAQGAGQVTMANGHGTLGRFDSAGATSTRVWLRFLGGDGTLAVLGSESTNDADVPIYMVAQGAGTVILANQDDVDLGNNIAQFASRGPGSFALNFQQQAADGTPALIGSAGGSLTFFGFRQVISPQTGATINVTIPDTGKHYDNVGAGATVNFVLPKTTTTTTGVNYCFHRDAAQTLRITVNATDQIAIGATNSALGGTVTSAAGAAANFASICVETHRVGQWVTVATPDKAQWTIP